MDQSSPKSIENENLCPSNTPSTKSSVSSQISQEMERRDAKNANFDSSTRTSESCQPDKSFLEQSDSCNDDENGFLNENKNSQLNLSGDPDPVTSTPDGKNDSEHPNCLSNNPNSPTSTPDEKSESAAAALRYKLRRPSNLVIRGESLNSNDAAFNMANLHLCSPVRSPYPSNDSNDSLISENDTPNTTCDNSLSRKGGLTESEIKMICLLRRFGLSHLSLIFIEQEVDVELFLTLTDQDLKEIGIERKTDRIIFLSVIAECNQIYQS